MGGSDITVEILKEIRDEIRVLRADTNVQFNGVRVEIQGVRGEILQLRADTNERFGVVESSLLDLTEHRHSFVQYARAMSERDARLEARFGALESRVDKLESK
jgi:hypothetical protein